MNAPAVFRRAGRSATLSGRCATLVLAVLAWQPAAGAAGVGDAEELIAFCRSGIGSGASGPCICSVEQVEDLITPARLLDHMRDRRAAGAASAAELRIAAQHVRAVCAVADPGGDAEQARRAGLPVLAPSRRPVEPQ